MEQTEFPKALQSLLYIMFQIKITRTNYKWYIMLDGCILGFINIMRKKKPIEEKNGP